MAKYESRTIQIHPAREQAVISKMERFGWVLKSNQDVVTKDSHHEVIGDTLYSVTETERYIKLMFQRDTEDEKYAAYVEGEALYGEMEELNKKVNELPYKFYLWPSYVDKWKYIVAGLLCFFVGGGIGMAIGKSGPSLFIGAIVLALLMVAAVVVYRIKRERPEIARLNEKLVADKAQARKALAEKQARMNALGL